MTVFASMYVTLNLVLKIILCCLPIFWYPHSQLLSECHSSLTDANESSAYVCMHVQYVCFCVYTWVCVSVAGDECSECVCIFLYIYVSLCECGAR